MSDLNDVKAGKYQLVAVRWDQITSEPGDPLDYIRHRRGDIVDLNAEDARRLVAAGAVVKPGQIEKTKAEQARAIAERASADYQAILAGLPEDVRGEIDPGTVSQDGGNAPSPGSVKFILAEVGEDRDKALAALEEEQAKDEPRSTLVDKLQAIVGT